LVAIAELLDTLPNTGASLLVPIAELLPISKQLLPNTAALLLDTLPNTGALLLVPFAELLPISKQLLPTATASLLVAIAELLPHAIMADTVEPSCSSRLLSQDRQDSKGVRKFAQGN